MIRLFNCMIIMLLAVNVHLVAQSVGTLRGKAAAAATRAAAAGVTIRVLDTKFGAIARSDGSFEVRNVPAGTYSVQAAAVGYAPRLYADVVIRPGRATFLDVELEERAAAAAEVTVEGDYFQAASAITPTGMLSLSTEEIRRAPGSAGDIARVLNASPSIARIDDNRNDIAVRGGSALENSFYIDNIPFTTINYFPKYGATGGSISFVNIDAVRSADFYTGGYGAAYNALSSVIDIKLRNGNDEQFDMQADLNMIGMGVGVEGPLGGGSSYFLSVQRGYFDLLRNFLEQSGVPRWGNAQFKVALDAGANDKISLLGVSAISDFRRDSTEGRQKNVSENTMNNYQHTYGVNWLRLFGESGYMNTSLSFSTQHGDEIAHIPQYDSLFYDLDYTQSHVHLRNVSSFVLDKRLTLDAGLDLRAEWQDFRTFLPARVITDTTQEDSTHKSGEFSAFSEAAFATVGIKIGDNLTVSPGARLELRQQSLSGGIVGRGSSLLPRVSAQYHAGEELTFAAAYGLYSQDIPMGLLQYSVGDTLPDKQILARHAVVSAAWLARPDMRVSVEGYAKWYSNMPVDLDQPFRSPIDDAAGEPEYQPVTRLGFTGTARAVGVEAMAQKKMSDGWYATLGAAYSRSFYTGGDGIERSRTFDNRFALTLTGGWAITDEWQISGQLGVVGGNAYSPLDEAQSAAKGRAMYLMSDYMNEHLPTYHTLNLRVDKRFPFAASSLTIYVSVLNVLNTTKPNRIGWNPYTRNVYTYNHIGLLPMLGIEWEM